jgi:SAM-dependent methyltransferase
MAEWFEDESFWEELYPVMFPARRFDSAPEEVDKVLVLADREAAGTVVDLCCGPGRHSVELAARGWKVTGVDRTAFLLEKAKERGRARGVEVEWVLEDMRRFRRPGAYDLALSLFTSFGYFDEKGEDRAVLANLCESLVPGGVLVMDVMGKERLAAILQATTSEETEDGSVLVQRHEIFDDWTRIRNEWILIREGRVRRWRFHHTIYGGAELRMLLEGAGFAEVTLFGDLDGGAYGPGAQRLVAVARKGDG